MKFYTIILILIIFSCNSKLEKDEYASEFVLEKFENGNVKSIKKYKDSESLMSYKYLEYFASGMISFEANIENDLVYGKRVSFYENGNHKEVCILTDSCETDDCCPDGYYKRYYKNGKIKESFYQKNGAYNGLQIKYDSLGIKIVERNVRNNMVEGIEKWFDKNEFLAIKKEYLNDTLIGFIYYFNEIGDTIRYKKIKNGKPNFPIKYWNENRETLYGYFINYEKKLVKWTWKNKDGEITKEDIVLPINGKYITPDY